MRSSTWLQESLLPLRGPHTLEVPLDSHLIAAVCPQRGMKLIAEALASRKTPCFSLTSAGLENVSTGNWTFTQCILDGLAGSPLIDTNEDGNI